MVFAMKKIGFVNSQDAHVTRQPCNELPAKMAKCQKILDF